ncbi:conjugal transfer protein, partial (plasmid) [Lactobacillus salivarius]|nr:conjugal transfer protein [Ligilactobacillus salivarius]
MRFRKNYDKERANKVDNRTHIIGNPVTLFLLWLIWSYFVSWISAYFTIGFSTLLAWLNSPNSQQALHDGQLINFEPVMEVWKNTTNFGNYQLAITTNKLLFFGLTIIFSL